MSAKDEIFNHIQNNPNLVYLKRYDKDWVFSALSGICKAEKKQSTLENMRLFVATLESDLESMLSGAGSESDSVDEDFSQNNNNFNIGSILGDDD